MKIKDIKTEWFSFEDQYPGLERSIRVITPTEEFYSKTYSHMGKTLLRNFEKGSSLVGYSPTLLEEGSKWQYVKEEKPEKPMQVFKVEEKVGVYKSSRSKSIFTSIGHIKTSGLYSLVKEGKADIISYDLTNPTVIPYKK